MSTLLLGFVFRRSPAVGIGWLRTVASPAFGGRMVFREQESSFRSVLLPLLLCASCSLAQTPAPQQPPVPTSTRQYKGQLTD